MLNDNSLYDHLKPFSTYEQFEYYLGCMKDNKTKGTLFELFTKNVLEFHPFYKEKFNVVLMYDEIDTQLCEELKLPEKDMGIDLLGIGTNSFTGIQCKFRKDKKTIPWGGDKGASTFPALCYKSDVDDDMFVTNCYDIHYLLKQTGTHLYGSFWDTVTPELIYIIKKKLVYQKVDIPLFKPYPHQQNAIAKLIEHFKDNDKGILNMACGTGKTLTTYFFCRDMKYKTIVFLLPSLNLLSQTLLEWHSQWNEAEYILIGSSSNTNDQIPGLITTTDQVTINNWYTGNKNKPRVILSTYDSSYLLKKLKGTDITIFDEAHNTAQINKSKFNTLIKWKNTNKKLFMTATPKHYIGSKDDVYGMNDEDVYGTTIFEYNTHEGISEGILTDYMIVTPIIFSESIEKYIKSFRFSFIDNERYTNEMIISAIMLVNTIKEQKVNKMLTYHNSIKGTITFINLFKMVCKKMDINVKCFRLDGKFSMNKRSKIIRDFERSEIGLLASVDTLSEGVSINCIDSICFIDSRNSSINIQQCCGRALRKFEGKAMSYIIIPSIIESEDDNPENLYNVISSLAKMDHKLIAYFRELSKSKGKFKGKQRWITKNVFVEEKEVIKKIDFNVWNNNIITNYHNKLERYKTLDEKINYIINWCNTNKKYPQHKSKLKTAEEREKEKKVYIMYYHINKKIKSKDDKLYIKFSKCKYLKELIDNKLITENEKINYIIKWCNLNKKYPQHKSNLETTEEREEEKKVYIMYKNFNVKIKSKDDELYIKLSKCKHLKELIDEKLMTKDGRINYIINWCNLNKRHPQQRSKLKNAKENKEENKVYNMYHYFNKKIKTKDDELYIKFTKCKYLKELIDKKLMTNDERINYIINWCNLNKKYPQEKSKLGTAKEKEEEKKVYNMYTYFNAKIKSKDDELYIKFSKCKYLKELIDARLEKRK